MIVTCKICNAQFEHTEFLQHAIVVHHDEEAKDFLTKLALFKMVNPDLTEREVYDSLLEIMRKKKE